MYLLFTFLFSFKIFADPVCLSHKGEHTIHPENSLGGMKAAIELGAQGLEIDVRHTRDGVPIIQHDFILWRTAISKRNQNCPRLTPIPRLTFEEIDKNCELSSNIPLATLEQVLNDFKGTKVYLFLEIKDPPSNRLLRLLSAYPDKKYLRIHSHWDSLLNQYEELQKEYPLQIPVIKISKYWPRLSSKWGNNVWWPFYWLLKINPEIYQRETGLFLANSKESMASAQELKVNYVTTDDPQLCQKIESSLNTTF